MIKKLFLFLLVFSILIIGLASGFFLGRKTPQSTIEPVILPIGNEPNKLFSTQIATIRGEITKIEGRNLHVKNLNNQVTGTVPISNRAIISKAGTKQNSASPSSDLSKIELNKEALIGLEMVNGEYLVVSIQFTFPTPSLPPVVKQTTP